ncbi:OmpA family protein [Nocardia brasiliensis]
MIAIVATATSAEPQPVLADPLRSRLNNLAKQSKQPGGAVVRVVSSTTSPAIENDLTPLRSDQVEHAPAERDRKITQALDSLAEQLLVVTADHPGLDLLPLLDRTSQLPATEVHVMSSGLSTATPDFRALGWNFDPAAVVDDLARQGLLPDLSGRHVTLHNMGIVAGSQPRLTPANRAAVERLWLTICQRSGASCSAVTDGAAYAAPLATLPVPIVDVPDTITDGGCPVWQSLPDEVLFQPGSAELGASADPALRQVMEAVQHCNFESIGVTGHVADTGSGEDSVDLSGQRARAVANRLVQLGLSAAALGGVEGHGTREPVVVNFTNGQFDEAKARLNRRVELTYQRRGSK